MHAEVDEVRPMRDDMTIESRARRRKLPRILALALLGYGLLCLRIGDHRPFTCAACRLDRVDYRFLLFHWSRFQENECSRWYAANVEPTHPHAWAKCGHCERIGLPGLTSGCACYSGDPISQLSRSVQMRTYQHSRDLMKTKDLFLRMGRREEGGQALMEQLSEWASAGCPGTWEEWRAEHREAGMEP